jgi:hypothetical protein
MVDGLIDEFGQTEKQKKMNNVYESRFSEAPGHRIFSVPTLR